MVYEYHPKEDQVTTMIYLDILCIAIVAVFIIEKSGAIDSLKSLIARIISRGVFTSGDRIKLKPLDCPLCATFWTGVIYLLCVHQFTFVNLLYVCVVAWSTQYISMLMDVIGEILRVVLSWILTQTNKI